MLPFRLVYHPNYNLHLGTHVFPSKKYAMVRERLVYIRFAGPEDFVEPEPATDDDILLVHEPAWVEKLKHGTLSYHEILKMEIPYTKQTVEAFWLAAGGTIRAARLALADGLGFNLGGGFHHAFATHGEGFCAINDVAIAIRRLQKDGAIERAMVVDVDVHQGNGTAAVFAGDPSVFTLSIHQANNYPTEKPPSNLDINLADGTGDPEYLELLQDGLAQAWERFRPDLMLYVAGADPYCEDQLGGLALTFQGLLERDRLVLGKAVSAGVPVAVVLAGGYAERVVDTVTIHANTVRAAKEVVDGAGRIHRRDAETRRE